LGGNQDFEDLNKLQ
jgi:hypothetical protein